MEKVSNTLKKDHHLIIKPLKGWRLLDLRELWEYKDLFYFLVWRDIKGLYAQSILGVGWAVIRPVFSMIVFTIILVITAYRQFCILYKPFKISTV